MDNNYPIFLAENSNPLSNLSIIKRITKSKSIQSNYVNWRTRNNKLNRIMIGDCLEQNNCGCCWAMSTTWNALILLSIKHNINPNSMVFSIPYMLFSSYQMIFFISYRWEYTNENGGIWYHQGDKRISYEEPCAGVFIERQIIALHFCYYGSTERPGIW